MGVCVRACAYVRVIEPEYELVTIQRSGSLQLCVSTIFHSNNPISYFAKMSHFSRGTSLALKLFRLELFSQHVTWIVDKYKNNNTITNTMTTLD